MADGYHNFADGTISLEIT